MLSASWRAVIAIALTAVGAASTQAGAEEVADRIWSEPKGSSSLVNTTSSKLHVVIDFAKLLSFEQPARTIIIGNPAVVDGTLSDEYTMILTGKSVGTTNMIVLGGDGQEILNTVISVVGNVRQMTTVHQGAAQQVYLCDGSCRLVSAPAAPAASK